MIKYIGEDSRGGMHAMYACSGSFEPKFIYNH